MRTVISAIAMTAWAIVFPAAQGSPQTPTPIHVLKITAGPSGSEEKGSFVLREERSIFNRSDDREVVVLFQWDGTPGAHKLTAQWRSPDGGQNSTSTIDYIARDRRFGAYWSLPLSAAIQLDHWSIEASVDGQPAGRFSFEVTDTKIAPAIVKRPRHRPSCTSGCRRRLSHFSGHRQAGRSWMPPPVSWGVRTASLRP